MVGMTEKMVLRIIMGFQILELVNLLKKDSCIVLYDIFIIKTNNNKYFDITVSEYN